MKSVSSVAVAASGVALMSAMLAAFIRKDLGAPRVELAAYSTSLGGRTINQRHNAKLAAAALDDALVKPNKIFSFNKRVGVWDKSRGYVNAPVSYEGLFAEAVGGGVCQVSTTLYNAVLLAGLPIVERHPHAVAPAYVAPGRDAAVAQYALDLRFRNTLPGPVLIRAETTGSRIVVRLFGTVKPHWDVRIFTDIRHVAPAYGWSKQSRHMALYAFRGRRNPGYGIPGYHVITYREISSAGSSVREKLAEDRYKPVHYLAGPATQLSDDGNLPKPTGFTRDGR